MDTGHKLTPSICSACGQSVFACRDHNSSPATVTQRGVGPVPHNGALVAGLNGTVYSVPASMVREGEPIYEWHTLAYRAHDEDGVPRMLLKIACGQFVPIANKIDAYWEVTSI